MLQITAKIDGMMCGMCEAHVKDAVRQAFPDAKKINASASKGELTFIIEEELPTPILKHELKAHLDNTGYKLGELTISETAKTAGKGLFGRLGHRKQA